MNTPFKLKINQVKVVLGLAVKLEDIPLKDGSIVSVESLEVGYPIFVLKDGVQAPLPEGDYELEDGTMIKVDATGIIMEITPPTTETPVEDTVVPEVEVEVVAEEDPAVNPVEEVIPDETAVTKEELTQIDEKVNTALAAIELIATEVATLKETMAAINTKMEKFAKSPAGTKIQSGIAPNETVNHISSKIDVIRNAMKQ